MDEVPYPLELVEWRDANFARDANEDDFNPESDDYINATVGWTRDYERWIAIVGEITPGGERAVTFVPQENVVNRKKLVIADDRMSELREETSERGCGCEVRPETGAAHRKGEEENLGTRSQDIKLDLNPAREPDQTVEGAGEESRPDSFFHESGLPTPSRWGGH